MNRICVICMFFALLCGVVRGQERKLFISKALHAVKTYIDSSAVRGIDLRYIQVPQKPWAIVLKHHRNDLDLRSQSCMRESYADQTGLEEVLNIESQFKPKSEKSLGAWVGYRGYGFGLSYSFQRTNGKNLSFSATGANYGLNLRIRRFHTRELEIRLWGQEDGESFDLKAPMETNDDIKVRTSIIDGFYMFNGKHFSYAAAYDQSVIQLRSAGSLMVGLMWYQTSLDYSSRLNALFIQALGGVGRIKIHEGSLGVGYAYNWVPVKNLLINVTAMPMVALYNRTKIYMYDSNYNIFLDEGETSPTGQKALPQDIDDESWKEDITIMEKDTAVKHAKISLNIDARMSITYNFDRFFLNVYGQVNHFSNSIEYNKLKLTDWYVNASLGFRL